MTARDFDRAIARRDANAERHDVEPNEEEDIEDDTESNLESE